MGWVEKETRIYFTIGIKPALQTNQTVSFLTVQSEKMTAAHLIWRNFTGKRGIIWLT